MKYVPFNQLPIFSRLKVTCEELRDGVILPMKKDLEDVRDKLKVERERRQASQEPTNPAKQAAPSRSEAVHTPNPNTGPATY